MAWPENELSYFWGTGSCAQSQIVRRRRVGASKLLCKEKKRVETEKAIVEMKREYLLGGVGYANSRSK